MAERRRRPTRRATVPAPLTDRRSPRARTQADDVRTWVERLTHARTKRQEWKNRYKVDELSRLFLGPQWQWDDNPDATSIHINKFFPTVQALMPGLLHQAPTFFVRSKPKGQVIESRQQAMAEAALDAIARQDNHLKLAGQLALQQSFFLYGALKTCYDPQTEPNPQGGQPLYVLTEQGYPLTDQSTGALVQASDPSGQPLTEPDRIVKDEVYEWRWVNACNLLLPDEGPDRRRWTWIGEEITVPLDEAQDDARFPKSLRDQLRATERPQAEGDDRSALEAPPEVDKKLWYTEIWDIKQKRQLIVAEGQAFGGTHFLLDEPLPDGVEDHPYSLLMYTHQIDPEPSPYPVPLTWNWLPLQREYNLRRRQMTAAAQRSARKVYFDQSTFANRDEAIAALQSTLDMEAVELTDTSRPPITLPDPSSPPDVVRDLAAIEKDWIETTGQTGERLANPRSDTATEAMLQETAASKRDAGPRDKVQDWLADAGRKMLQRLQGTLTIGLYVKLRGFSDTEFQEWVRATHGPMALERLRLMPGLKRYFLENIAQEKWQALSREDLQFEAEVVVQPGSSKMRIPEVERPLILAFLDRVTVMAQTAPELLTSRALLKTIADLYEVIPDSLIDELMMIGQKRSQMLQQALRAKQGGATGAPATNGNGQMGNVISERMASLFNGALGAA